MIAAGIVAFAAREKRLLHALLGAGLAIVFNLVMLFFFLLLIASFVAIVYSSGAG